ncbi:MAG: metallopeptidase family protein [Deltaproteobacteria bacterium]|nr:metallopeptidase family protein [Deltaproteobacteria bacterium]
MRLSEKEFDAIVKDALRRIPQEILAYLDNVLITVKKRPSRELLGEMGLPADEPLLGVYDGVSLPDRSEFGPPLYPDTIILFQEPLEDICNSNEELEREIAITVVHEIAHFLGISEKRLAELGYA